MVNLRRTFHNISEVKANEFYQLIFNDTLQERSSDCFKNIFILSANIRTYTKLNIY